MSEFVRLPLCFRRDLGCHLLHWDPLVHGLTSCSQISCHHQLQGSLMGHQSAKALPLSSTLPDLVEQRMLLSDFSTGCQLSMGLHSHEFLLEGQHQFHSEPSVLPSHDLDWALTFTSWNVHASKLFHLFILSLGNG